MQPLSPDKAEWWYKLHEELHAAMEAVDEEAAEYDRVMEQQRREVEDKLEYLNECLGNLRVFLAEVGENPNSLPDLSISFPEPLEFESERELGLSVLEKLPEPPQGRA